MNLDKRVGDGEETKNKTDTKEFTKENVNVKEEMWERNQAVFEHNSGDDQSAGCTEKTVVLLLVYLVQGLPFGFQDKYLPIYYRSQGVDYTSLSLFRMAYIPWLVKVVWAPIVGKRKNKAQCIVCCLLGLVSSNLVAFCIDPSEIWKFAVAMTFVNFVASLEDVAVDTYTIENMAATELGYGNIAQVVGFKIGMVIGSGGASLIAHNFGHSFVFIAMGLLQFLVLITFVIFTLHHNQLLEKQPSSELFTAETVSTPSDVSPRITLLTDTVVQRRPAAASKKHEAQTPEEKTVRKASEFSYRKTLQTPGTLWMIGFVLMYKLGEQGTLSLFPLFLLDSGLSRDQVNVWHGVVGQIASIVGSVFGGWQASNINGIGRCLTYACVLRAVIIFGIRLIVVQTNELLDSKDLFVIGSSFALLTALNFASGFLTTQAFTLMMLISQRAGDVHQGVHYSFLATAEVFGKLLVSVASGPIIDYYGAYTAVTLYLILTIAVLPLLKGYNQVFK